MSDEITIIVNTYDPFKKERREIGEYAGIKFMADPGLPDDEIRVLQDGKVVAKIAIR
ncbi:MAG: hypothetical protein KAS66_05445 [Candidatus Omnitrophica bacterium]|nr:hypothetical protein [Candidatus Omnitrophota bacterium]